MAIWKFGKRILDLEKKTYIMGILNLTPDSFFDGGKYNDPSSALNHALEIENSGADIIDIGAQSTKPGYKIISPEEEWARLSPTLKKLSGKLRIPISIDTFYPRVIIKALEYGIEIINDVSGDPDNEMIKIAAKHSCGLIETHNKTKKTPKEFFYDKLISAQENNLPTSALCFDPGIGFNKTREQDCEILKNLKNSKISDNALLIGISHKRTVKNLCEEDGKEETLYGTIALNTIAQTVGANILRVHDVKQAVCAARVYDNLIKK